VLHPDVDFTGPGKPLNGADEFIAAPRRRLGPMLPRNAMS